MIEKIYTIPVNDAFDACAQDHSLGCPFCYLHNKLENDETDIILGGAMMQPDIRIKTNELGFCDHHFSLMLQRNNRLGLALILESHLDVVRENVDNKNFMEVVSGRGVKACNKISKLQETCYICDKVNYSLSRMIDNAAYLWEMEKEFDNKLKNQPYFCLSHYKAFIESGRNNISNKKFSDFYKSLSETELKYFDELRKDVSWFCKKFDYRYENEPWNNSKDAIERAIRFLK